VTPREVKNLASGGDRHGIEDTEKPTVRSAVKSISSASVSEDSEEDDLPALITTVENLALVTVSHEGADPPAVRAEKNCEDADQPATRSEGKDLALVNEWQGSGEIGKPIVKDRQDSEDADQMVTGQAENIDAFPHGRQDTEGADGTKPNLAIRQQSSTEVNLCNQQQVNPPYKESLEAGARSLNMSADGKHSNSLEFTNIFQVEDLASSSSEDEDAGAEGGLRWVYSVNPAVHLEARINNNTGSWESVEATDSSLPILITDDIEDPSFKVIQTAINQGCSDLTSSISKTCTEDSITGAADTLALDALDCATSSSLLSETNSIETHLISEQIQLTVPEQIQLIPRRPSLGTSYKIIMDLFKKYFHVSNTLKNVLHISWT
jgi:hypothetical protein